MEGEEFVFNVSGSEDPLKILSKSVTWWELHGWHTHVGRAVQIVQCYLRTLAELVFPSPLIDLQPRRGSQAETAFTSSLAVRSKHMCVFVYVFVCVYACTHLCLTVCDPMDCNPSGSSVHEISQARILEQVVISYSRESSWPRDQTHVSCISCTGR